MVAQYLGSFNHPTNYTVDIFFLFLMGKIKAFILNKIRLLGHFFIPDEYDCSILIKLATERSKLIKENPFMNACSGDYII